MAFTPIQRAALIQGEQSARLAVRDRLLAYAEVLWNGLGSWRDADIDRFVAQIVPRVIAGQTTVAQLTDAYLAQLIGTAPAGRVDVTEVRGIPAEVVYRRPAATLYTELANGATFTLALAAAAYRLTSLVTTDLQLAMRNQASVTLGASGAEFYRRTLTGRENCALCVIASTQRYRKKELLPIHPGCDCGIAPLQPGDSEYQIIDENLLEATHDQVALLTGVADRGGRSPDYRQLIITREHGELGPVIGWRHQHFADPGDRAA